MMNNSLRWTVLGVALMAGTSMVLAQQQPPAAQPAPQQPTTVGITLTGEGGAQTRLAVPDLLALSNDKETQEAEIGRAHV